MSIRGKYISVQILVTTYTNFLRFYKKKMHRNLLFPVECSQSGWKLHVPKFAVATDQITACSYTAWQSEDQGTGCAEQQRCAYANA
jgi:hypothetical protein